MRFHKFLCFSLSAIIFLAPFCLASIFARASETSIQEIQFINDADFYKDIIKSETDYIKSLMFSNGALPKSAPAFSNDFNSKDLPDINKIPDEIYKTWKVGYIVPYFSEIAILGLLKASPNDSKETVKSFIEWYFNNINDQNDDLYGIDGTIYDYYVFQNPSNPDEIVQISAREVHMDEYEDSKSNPYNYDSTDSYAALFLRVLYEYCKTYEDYDIIISNKVNIDRILNALFATYDEEINLTYAKPEYEVYYLMDNCEVYYGLTAASNLFSDVFNDTDKANELEEYAKLIKNAIEKLLWNEETGYIAGIYKNKLPISSSDNFDFYPDATAQLYPIVYEVIDPESERAKTIYNRFNDVYGVEGKKGHDWTVLDKGDDFPWCLIANAAVKVGDYERADKFFTVLDERYLNAHEYPYYNAEAGHTLIAVSNMLEPKELIGVKNEVITASVNNSIDLGLILYPAFSDPGKVNVQIKDNEIAAFDKESGKLKLLSAGQTNINVSIDDNTFLIILNVTGTTGTKDNLLKTDENSLSAKNEKVGSVIIGLFFGILIIGAVIKFILYVNHTKIARNNNTKR